MTIAQERLLICDDHSERAAATADAADSFGFDSKMHDETADENGNPRLIMLSCDDLNPDWSQRKRDLSTRYPKAQIVYMGDHSASSKATRPLRTMVNKPARELASGCSPAMTELWSAVDRVARFSVTVLITGETGTGKEVVARRIHRQSKRANKPFVAVNCAAIPSELLESELFGHEKGSFTGATKRRPGRFERAQGGTLFLDEIGDMPMEMQAKLLRALQERSIERVGGDQEIPVDVRVVAATHQDLHAAIRQGKFREDLYYRLNVFPLTVPPLRDRAEDLPDLVSFFAEQIGIEGRPVPTLTPSALERLGQYDWPGNVRELANMMDHLSVMYPNGRIDEAQLPPTIRHAAGQQPVARERLPNEMLQDPDLDEVEPVLPREGVKLSEFLGLQEQSLIRQSLQQTGGVVAQAAKLLGLRRTTLVEKMRKYGIDKDVAA